MSELSSRYVFPDHAPSAPAPALIRTRIRIRCEPALLPGPLAPRRASSRALGRLARAVASRLNEARASKRGQIYFL